MTDAPMDQQDVTALAERLAGEGPIELTDGERRLVADALAQLAGAQAELATAQRLLRAAGASSARVAALTKQALTRARSLAHSDDPTAAVDLEQAAQAREQLLQRLAEARTGRAVVEAALAFARDAATLLR